MNSGTITWRNVNGPNPAEAARPLAYAQNSFNSAFDGLTKALEARQAANQNAYDRGQEADVLSFKEALQNARTPDDVRALQQQGMLDNIRARLDPKYRAQVLGLEDKRNQETQQNLLAQRKFDTEDYLYNNRAAIDELRRRAAQGDTEGVQTGITPEMAQNGVDGAAILEKAAAARLANNKDTREGDKLASDTNLAKAQIRHYANSDQNAADKLALEKQKMAWDGLAALDRAVAKAGKSTEGVGSQTVKSPKSAEYILGRLKDAGHSGKSLKEISQQIGNLIADPKYQGLTNDELTGIALQTTQTNKWFKKDGNDIPTIADAYINSEAFKQRQLADRERVTQAAKDSLLNSRLRDQYMVQTGMLPKLPDYEDSPGTQRSEQGGRNSKDTINADDSRFGVLMGLSSDGRLSSEDSTKLEKAMNADDAKGIQELYDKYKITGKSTYDDFTPTKEAPKELGYTPTGNPVEDQRLADRAAAKRAILSGLDMNDTAGRAIADVVTMIPRGLVGAYDSTAVRGMRALGINADYLSPHLVPDGVDPSSMYPLLEEKRLKNRNK